MTRSQNQQPFSDKSILKLIADYRNPSKLSSIWQLTNTLVPYILLWAIMIYMLSFLTWWYILPLIILATGFTVRLFIIFHDCGHGAFFRSKAANDTIGTILGILTFTPYHRWHHAHLMHHRTSGNLDKRGEGDIWTLTVDEYTNLPRGKQIIYRVYRNPIVLFLIGAPLMFLVSNRLTRKGFSKKERISVYVTNTGIAAIVVGLSLLTGFKTYLMIQLPITYFASVVGVYLFYVQHQYPEVNWYRDENWDYTTAAMHGASYFKLPRILQWFSGNIGFHNIHHLSSKIPNYRLQQCYRENEVFRREKPVTLFKSFSTLKLRLWDEQSKQLVTWKALNQRIRA